LTRGLPRGVKVLGKKLFFQGEVVSLQGVGTIQDLHYWVADGHLDTLLLFQNYFSVVYPTLSTATSGSIYLFSRDGVLLGTKDFSLPHLGSTKFNVASLLKEFHVAPEHPFGTLEYRLRIPPAVLALIRQEAPFYFLDRFYICYITAQGQPTFVHGIDRTHIFREGRRRPIRYFPRPEGRPWAPETPVNIAQYKKFSVILTNRSSRSATMGLVVSDINDHSLKWRARILPNGVHRFELTPENTLPLHPVELRMRIEGMASGLGRPLLFKEFPNGAVSALHG
jgi:hypothetical protein